MNLNKNFSTSGYALRNDRIFEANMKSIVDKCLKEMTINIKNVPKDIDAELNKIIAEIKSKGMSKEAAKKQIYGVLNKI